MNLFRIYISIFRVALVFAAGGFLFPANAQNYGEVNVPQLNLQNFSAVEIPENFSFGENVIWGAKTLFSHKDVKVMVPVSAYKREDVCNETLFRHQPVAVSAGIGMLVLQSAILSGEVPGTDVTAVWSRSLEEACEWLQSPESVALNFQSGGLIVEKAPEEVFSAFLEHLKDQGLDDYILVTADNPLSFKVAPTGEYWWKCRDDSPPTKNSVCQATLSASPYKQHRELVQLQHDF